MAHAEKNQNVQSIKFMRGGGDSSEESGGEKKFYGYLMIFINTGEVYILDCLKMELLNSEDGSKEAMVQG